jgi:hypothetical protein
MKVAFLFFMCLFATVFAGGSPLNAYVTSAKEVQDLLQEGSKNCYMIVFVWKGDAETAEPEANEVTTIFDVYPECYNALLDIARSDTKALLNILRFDNEKDSFSSGREITKDDTPLLLAVVEGKGHIASGPKPHKALKKELDSLYRTHIKTDITYEG